MKSDKTNLVTGDEETSVLMAATIEEEVSRQRAERVRVVGIERRFEKRSSSFRTERLIVTLDRGAPLRVFFKDLNPSHQTENAKALRSSDIEPGLRELKVYRKLLDPAIHGTLALYGARWEPDAERYWLFLEDGGRTLLGNSQDLTRWVAAARWIARFHARSRNLGTVQTEFLPRYDSRRFSACAERVAGLLPSLAKGERSVVGKGLERFHSLAGRLESQPRGLIHGQYFGENILLRRVNGELRIAVVDWETAAVGPATFDLASLTSGTWTREERREMQCAYFEEYRSCLPGTLEWDSFRSDLEAVSIWHCLEWIAWWGRHRRLSHDCSRFISELATLTQAEPLI